MLAGFYAWEVRDLPAGDELREQLFARYPPKENTTWVPLWAISPKLQTAVIIWEDPSFLHHRGLNYKEIGRSLLADIRAGEYVRGGSTITQQLAKNLFLSPEKTLRRKFREAVLARRIEGELAKNQILEIYLNVAEWGPKIAGAEAAALRYFCKPASELDWSDSALLAGILPNPGLFNPHRSPEQARRRRTLVLLKLRRFEKISLEEFRAALETPCCQPVPEDVLGSPVCGGKSKPGPD